ncbi:PqiB family protein [Noviherbaspirillum pedocola]|uniref:MCE family protein n=1 Tax=Noviherbaspirillum pedocola TaxID=2801341 RepID=A0A934T316_9BURK|nr:MlaD family protein [Noviherbaspirillum pedocola]MBK4738464.1 MCE family protein [Noviherbaspirillum pedocola]
MADEIQQDGRETVERRAPESDELPEAAVAPRSRWKLQIIWLIPIVAALIGLWLAVSAILQKGPTIEISFKTAEGLEAGKTKLKYKDVDIGVVESVTLAKDLAGVVATAELMKDFKPHLVKDTRFWVVRPRISGGTVSGLSTLLSGAYIGVDVGRGKEITSRFVGAETPPAVRLDTPGTEFILNAENIGSFDAGVPLFYRQIPVGQVVSYELNRDGKGLRIKVFVNKPYDGFVTANTRFWNASGIKLKVDANGVRLDTQSLASVIIGGIAFDNPISESELPAAMKETSFVLFPDRDEAMKNPESDVLKFVMVFDQSVRGLTPGAPVDFRGINIGEVTAIRLSVQEGSGRVLTPVEVSLYPQRLRKLANESEERSSEQRRALLDAMVARGMRAQLRAGNLLTGQLYISVDYVPRPPQAAIAWQANPPEFPTAGGNLQEIQALLASIANKIDKMPLEEIGNNLRKSLGAANTLLARLDREVAPEMRETLGDARKALASVDRMMEPNHALQQDARATLREVQRAAGSLRVLADYLERHPEALLRGKSGEGQ